MTQTVQVVIRFAWWWTWIYLPGVQTMCLLGLEPDEAKFCAIAGKAVRIRMVPWRGIKA